MSRAGTVKEITSTANPTIKAARALQARKARNESGLFLAEGQKLIEDALSVGWWPQMVFALQAAGSEGRQAQLAAKVRAAGSDVIFTNATVMEKLSRRDNPQTMIGVFDQRFTALNAMTGGTLVALEAPRDPGNVGTIIRTIDAVGASGLILVGPAADPFGVETVRATMGSIFHVPLARADSAQFGAFVARWQGQIIGTHLAASKDIRAIAPQEPQLLVMGTEQAGLTDELAQKCTTLTKIPMVGAADSLNLAVATALALYELRRPFL